ncbi:MAG: hypothetical protein K2X93_16285, partial [Candidatus Obscuribacterales bacterium]|nr:hypothetical protein [Candidatus Obscuribacterales bacterium]
MTDEQPPPSPRKNAGATITDDPITSTPSREDRIDDRTYTSLLLEAESSKDLVSLFPKESDVDKSIAAEKQPQPVDPVEQEKQRKLAESFTTIPGLSAARMEAANADTLNLRELGISFRQSVDSALGSGSAISFSNGIVQTRGEFGVKTEFPQGVEAPLFNGQPVRSLTFFNQDESGHSLSLTTKDGTTARLTPEEATKFAEQTIFSFDGKDGQTTTLRANGDKHIVAADGTRTVQFGPFDPDGRILTQEKDIDGRKVGVTYFQDGKRQIDFDPPRKDGASIVTEMPNGTNPHYEAKMLTSPAEVPKRLAQSLKALETSTTAGDTSKQLEQIRRLAELEKQSPQAKEALDKFARTSPENNGMVQYARFNQDGGPIHVLLESGKLSAEARAHLLKAAATDLTANTNMDSLTPEQATLAARGMAFALGERRDNSRSAGETANQLQEVLRRALDGEARDAAMKASFDMIKLADKPTIERLKLAEPFVSMYVDGHQKYQSEGQVPRHIQQQVEQLTQRGTAGNTAAAKVVDQVNGSEPTYMAVGFVEEPAADAGSDNDSGATPSLVTGDGKPVIPPLPPEGNHGKTPPEGDGAKKPPGVKVGDEVVARGFNSPVPVDQTVAFENLPPDVRELGRRVLDDLKDNPNMASVSLQIALLQAAQRGV